MKLRIDGFPTDETDQFAKSIVACRKCPRVIEHCRAVANKEIMRRSAFANERYWGRPVPGFGTLPVKLLIVGLAPGAHGANRTSRMFTGDDSGLWLYRALHKAGFAETSGCTEVGDNRLIDCAITAVTHCAPPGNKPAPDEIRNCEPYLLSTIKAAKPKVILALGAVAWMATLRALEKNEGVSFGRGASRPAFEHGIHLTVKDSAGRPIELLASYHVSRQNTNTGRLTVPMLDKIFSEARRLVSAKPKAIKARST